MNRRSERGAGTVLVAAGSAVILAVVAGVLWMVNIVVVKHQVDAAADLAALSGATAVQHGGEPCSAVAHAVRESQLKLLRCEVSGGAVTVELQGQGPALLGFRPKPQAISVAGPGADKDQR